VKRKKNLHKILNISTKFHPNPPSNLGDETCGGQIQTVTINRYGDYVW